MQTVRSGTAIDVPMMVVGAMLLDAYQHGHKVDKDSFQHFVYKQVSTEQG